MKEPIVISLGGSVLVPDGIDIRFLKKFATFVKGLSRQHRVAVICGGGNTARQYIASARVAGVRNIKDQHWIGIRATQVNAEVLRAVLGLQRPVQTAYQPTSRLLGRLNVAAGSRPGSSTDLGSVILARALGARRVYNVTNVDGVYSADPRRVRSARLLSHISWKSFRKMFGRISRPGAHYPFDPIASREAQRHGIQVVVCSSDLLNLQRAVLGKPFRGTLISAS